MEEQVKRIIKIIIFALPNRYYKMAATEIAEKFCDTIYKNQEDIDKYPRKEIIEIVENYLTNHLNAEDTEEQKQLIIKTILDKMANPFQTIFKSENVNLLLVKKYLEMDNVLKEVILESVEKLKKLQGKEEENVKEGVEEENVKEEPVVLPYKTMSVGQSPISNLIVGDITGEELPYKMESDNQSNQENNNENNEKKGGGDGDMLAKVGNLSNSASALMSAAKTGVDTLASVTNTPFAASISAGPGIGPSDGSGSGSGSHHSQCCPLLDDNLLGMLKGIFTVDLLKGFYKEGAELTVDKINEQLSDVTKEPAIVKQEIYDKILEVFRAHLTSEEGREMIFKYINTIMEANIKQLTEEKEIAKQGFISILKHGSPEIKDIFESALDRVLSEKNLNDLEAVNKDNIDIITESMKKEIKEFIIDKYKENTGKDIYVEVTGENAVPSAPVQAVAIPVTDAADAKQDATLVTQALAKQVADAADATQVADAADASVATEVVKQDATLDAKQDANAEANAVATEVVKQDETPVETPVAEQNNQEDSNKVGNKIGGAKKQKRFTKKNKRFTKKQKRSQSKKRRQTKRRVNKSGRVRIPK